VLPDVLARVNGENIEKAEFERALSTIQAQNNNAPIPTDRRDEIYRSVLDQLIAYHLLMQESKARKVEVSDADLDTRIAEVKKQFPTEEEFNKALASRGMTADSLKQEARQQMVLAKLVEDEVKPHIKVGDGDIKDFYDKNPDRFKQPEAVRASHILIKIDPNS